jgi:hypothetical protein
MKRDAGMAMAQDNNYSKYSDYTPYSNYSPYSSAAEAAAAKMQMGKSRTILNGVSLVLNRPQRRLT